MLDMVYSEMGCDHGRIVYLCEQLLDSASHIADIATDKISLSFHQSIQPFADFNFTVTAVEHLGRNQHQNQSQHFSCTIFS